MTSNGVISGTRPKFIAPTINLSDNAPAALQQQIDDIPSSKRGIFSNRVIHQHQLSNNTATSYKIRVSNFASLSPLNLGSKYISDLIQIDSNTPELHSIRSANFDGYNFDFANGLGDFTRFEKVSQKNLPDKIFEEYNSTECMTKMGLFPEIERSWIVVDNKLMIWNYKSAQREFLTIDEIKYTILAVKLVKPKPNVFLDDINYILVVSTPMDIHIFIIKFDKFLNNLEIFNPDLSVSTQGLIVNNFISYDKTNEIFFSGEGDEVNIWKLDYSNKSTFRKNRCDKICLTKNNISSFLPITKLPGIEYLQSSGTESVTTEAVVSLEIDQSRGILYTLSNTSNIRAYQIYPNKDHLGPEVIIRPSTILKNLSTSVDIQVQSLSQKKLSIVSIQSISRNESSNLFLVAVTDYGCRIFIYGSTAINSESFSLSSYRIKFPPSKIPVDKNPELDVYAREKQYTNKVRRNQQNSLLLKNTKFSKIISPGVFLSVKSTNRSDRLFICTPSYGFLKGHGVLIEDAEFVDNYKTKSGSKNSYIHDIVQLTPSMNASNKPTGYSNVLATQYTKEPLQFAVLTNTGISIYKYRTPDNILQTLQDETLEKFIEENGLEETTSTLLYLSCQYGRTDSFKNQAQVLFSTYGNNARLAQSSKPLPLSKPHESQNPASIDQVILSDRFYGTCLLISRLFRDFWNKQVFMKLPHIKILSSGQVEVQSIKEDNLLIQGLNIDKQQVEYFIGSVIILLEFFETFGNNVPGLNAPNYSSDPARYESEICLRAEHIAFSSIIKVLDSMKEALSFLMVLIEESQVSKLNFFEILKFLSTGNQLNLLTLSFRDLLVPNPEVKNLIKDLLSSIMNKNIMKGGSIDLIANSLQSRCASFCSPNDVFIFKATENLQRAKSIGSKDNDLKSKCLDNSVKLFEKAWESLTLENIENSVNIMLDLNYITGAIEFLLNIANKINSSFSKQPSQTIELASNYTAGSPSQNKLDNISDFKMRLDLYRIIFQILKTIDVRAINATESNNQVVLSEIVETRDLAYETAFNYPDKIFHYQFYQWFIDQGVSERLLGINTPYILRFLEEKSEDDLKLSDLLWLYHAKRENYFSAAQILYSLAISDFKLLLNQRMEYLSRANGFCNCVCPPNLRQKMIELSMVIQELFDVASVQLDILTAIDNDKRISKNNKEIALASLNYKVLTISEIFNSYADPLGYYDLCLLIFKVSDYRNSDDILKRWELFFEKIYTSFKQLHSGDSIYSVLSSEFIKIGKKLASNDLVFPVDELIRLIAKYINSSTDENNARSRLNLNGHVVDMFIKSGVSMDKLYYILRNMIENSSFEIFDGYLKVLKTEIVHLIKTWYQSDRKLRDVISNNKIRELDEYSIIKDPINDYIKASGMPI